ncbi:MAG: DUF4198 domain-containing protein [Bacillota bacterium]|nr:DUF4198 domain-containing protein [Bacillota bacterium]
MNEKSKITLCDTTDLMVYGHEPWLEMAGSHGHAGGSVDVYVKWGHNMQTDGLARKEGMAALVITPGGEKEELALADGGPDYYTLHFSTPADGFYHVVAKNTGDYVLDKEYQYHQGTRREYPDAAHAIHYVQYAQTFVPVGHDLAGIPRQGGMELEIVPEIWKQWRAGDQIALQVQFRGKPLDTMVMDVACDGPGGYKQWKESAGEDGRIRLQVGEPGRYLVVARREVPEREEGVYDLLSLTATLCFIVTK